MDLKELRNILEKEGGKIIIVEDEKPTLVVSLFGGKEKKVEHGAAMDRLVQKPNIEAPSPVSSSRPFTEELTIDDLPV